MSLKVKKSMMSANLKNKLNAIIEDYPDVAKDLQIFNKLLIEYIKVCEHQRKTRSNSNTGLGKPRNISENLTIFLTRLKDELVVCKTDENVSKNVETLFNVLNNEVLPTSRTDITKILTCYIKEHELQIEDNKLYFKFDAELANLFKFNTGDVITLEQARKCLGIKCVKDRLNEPLEDIKADTDGRVTLDEQLASKLNITETDSLSWRELQKILFRLFV